MSAAYILVLHTCQGSLVLALHGKVAQGIAGTACVGKAPTFCFFGCQQARLPLPPPTLQQPLLCHFQQRLLSHESYITTTDIQNCISITALQRLLARTVNSTKTVADCFPGYLHIHR